MDTQLRKDPRAKKQYFKVPYGIGAAEAKSEACKEISEEFDINYVYHEHEILPTLKILNDD